MRRRRSHPARFNAGNLSFWMFELIQTLSARGCRPEYGFLAVMLTLSPMLAADEPVQRNVPAAISDGSALPALTVNLITPQLDEWPRTLSANGYIAAWQEAQIGAEIHNYRIVEVLVEVGDAVQRDQRLATIASDALAAEFAQAQARVAEAEAQLAEARANAQRARNLRASEALTQQQVNQMLTAEQAATARLQAARADLKTSQVRLAHVHVLAPDAGIISARTATVGSNTQAGQELFRLIRGGRLEWQAEVVASELGNLQPGVAASITTPDGSKVSGTLRVIAPTVDARTGNALVYVDLELGSVHAKAGMFARGEFALGQASALTLPQSAVVQRDGKSFVYSADDTGLVRETNVTVGRRVGDRIEILTGISSATRVVASGVGFLTDGDRVRVAHEQ